LAFQVALEEEAARQLSRLDKTARDKIAKKLAWLEREDAESRHLRRGLPVFVEEVGGYRIVFKTRADLKQKRVVFVGNHKEYERWYKGQLTPAVTPRFV